MEFTEGTTLVIATILMVGALILAFVPIMPGPILVWSVAIVFAVIEGFQRMTPVAAIAATIVMILGSTSDLWMNLFGVRSGGLSCLSSIGAFIGGLAGTFFIPIPVVGTIIGSVSGAVLVELVRIRELRRAIRAGQTTAKMMAISYGVQLSASIIIFVVYIISIQTTA
jgi:uncharacterized protein YqgC (DUF456 family)